MLWKFLGPNGDGGGNPKIAELARYVSDQYGEKFIRPKAGESLENWSHRVIGKTLESGGVELKNFKLLDTGRGQ